MNMMSKKKLDIAWKKRLTMRRKVRGLEEEGIRIKKKGNKNTTDSWKFWDEGNIL